MQKIAKYSLKAALIIIVYFFFLNTVTFANYLNNKVREILFYETKTVVVGEKTITVEIADNEKKRIKGLSYRKNLKEDYGMLFVSDNDGSFGIWMKDMNFPIDIIWVNKHFEIVYIEENVLPSTFPETFKSDIPARFVLEVKSGFVKNNNIKKGDLMTIL